jgi:hypothetical protein
MILGAFEIYSYTRILFSKERKWFMKHSVKLWVSNDQVGGGGGHKERILRKRFNFRSASAHLEIQKMARLENNRITLK